MTYGEHAIGCLRSDLGFWREVENKWVVVYEGMSGIGTCPQSTKSPAGIHYLRLAPETDWGWTAAGINNCTLFDTYEEAQSGAQMSDYIMKPGTLARIVQLTIKVDVHLYMSADRPIGTLDALAEI